MRSCPVCFKMQPKTGSTKCEFCGYEEKPLTQITKSQIGKFLSSYDCERIEDGVRIVMLKDTRDFTLLFPVILPHFVTEIGANAFSDSKYLLHIELPDGLRVIGDGAFSYCELHKTVFIPSSVTYIGSGAFAHCGDLNTMFIPPSVRYIGKGAFAHCDSLKVIWIAASAQTDGWDEDWLEDCPAFVEWSVTDEP